MIFTKRNDREAGRRHYHTANVAYAYAGRRAVVTHPGRHTQ